MTLNQELDETAKTLNISNYIPCRMKDQLIGNQALLKECGIVNLQNTNQQGSHWICYYRDGDKKYSFSSYGDDAPIELQNYLGHNIVSSTFQVQEFGETICGEYCLLMLYLCDQGIDFEHAVLSLVTDN